MDKQSLKVLLLTTSFPLTKESRSGVFILRMIENLPAHIRVTVLTPDDSSTRHYTVSDRYALLPFRYALKSWQGLAHGDGGIMAALAQSRLNFLLIAPLLCSCFLMTCWYARKADVIHANWSINGLIAGLVGLIFNKPVITTLRGSDVNSAVTSWLMRQLAGSCLSHSKSVVTVSPALRQALIQQFPIYRHKIKVVANGIAPAFFIAGDTRAATERPVRFLYAGNLIIGKGVQVILEAAAALSVDNWLLDIVGEGAERENLEAFCQEKGLQSNVHFHGSVAPEQMPEFMGRADVFVFASFAEGRPNVVLEAMAAGLPVLASSIPAVQELIVSEREGLLFPPGNALLLSEQMTRLLSNSTERRSIGENARRTVTALNLSWQETGRRYAALYEEAVN